MHRVGRILCAPARRWRSYTITPAAIVLLAIFIGAAVGAFVAPEPANLVAFTIAVIVLAVPAADRLSAGRGGSLKTLQERQDEFPAKRRARDDERADPSVEAEAWARERQRYGERS